MFNTDIVDVNAIVEELEPTSKEDLVIRDAATHGIQEDELDDYYHARVELGMSHQEALYMCPSEVPGVGLRACPLQPLLSEKKP